ncbi:putative transglycosylase associated protein [Catenulispora acidiphila DSM 44928]|uniref:Putative transglycosylase associated protein n=1 Tax=Catenulispora acidiphila (strain DSM 44928 / JCM 14897 / NBRC 102108 / NRRL B-24433 / ID139908) TaxID=479433 RepID=C7QE54_CATAD|nr:hypothetical protein [Catenulispora acidiphila]ACU76642.1 putative transglycosylase associated protein [Catenulispora acidiphila DSM 44928]
MSFFTLLWLAALGLGIGALGRAVVKDGTPMATWMTAVVGVVGAVGGGSVIHAILGDGHTLVATLLGVALAALLVMAITSWQRTRGEGEGS